MLCKILTGKTVGYLIVVKTTDFFFMTWSTRPSNCLQNIDLVTPICSACSVLGPGHLLMLLYLEINLLPLSN